MLLKIGIAMQVGAYYPRPMQTISLKLPDALLARLEEESRLRRTNKSALVRAALERELAPDQRGKPPSCYDLAGDLAGSIKGLPKDIATNPKYMEGFGE
ncbi:MAG: CopG family transcriptional regulator [Verrucomicrobiales bacterium]